VHDDDTLMGNLVMKNWKMYQYFLYPNNTIVNVVHLEIDIAGTKS
jgi:hypothetical protein